MADKKKKSVASQPSLGKKVVDFFPSKHPDPKRAKEQERGLQSLIDFLVPQTKEDIAIDLALTASLGPLGKPAKKAVRSLEVMKKGQKWLGDWMTARKHLPTFAEDKSISGLGGMFNSNKSQKILEQNFPTELMDTDLKGSVIGRYVPNTKKVELHPMMQDEFTVGAYSKRANIPNDEYLESLGVHEYTHALTDGDNLLSPRVKNYINKMKDNSYQKFGGPDNRIYDFESHQWKDATTDRIKYIEKPTETYARVMEIRKQLRLDPLRMDNVLDQSKLFKTNEPYTELREIYGHNEIENMVNNLPAVVVMDMKLKEPKNENKTTY